MLGPELDAKVARFNYLPGVLELTPAVAALLDVPSDPALRDSVNRYLEGINATAGAEMIYVLDPSGTSVAASDWDRPGTTIGENYSFRPYVVDALAQGRGRFYGVGITSRRPGYYLSYALRRGPNLRGVVTVKIDIEGATSAWRGLPGDVLVLDERGVVILSTRDELKYRPLAPLDAGQLAEVRHSKPYGDAPLQPLRWVAAERLAPDAQLVTLDAAAYLASVRALHQAPWRVVVLDALKPLRAAARYAAITAGLLMSVLLLIAVVLWQRRRALRHKLANQAALQAAHDSLEAAVLARTQQLRAAQNELIHAEKMAALGQMSAVMVHELNQPLTALRTLADSAAVLLQHDRLDDVRGNLQRIAGMVDRLARLTLQLKTFAHKRNVSLVAVPLSRCIADAKTMVGAALAEHEVALEVEVRPAALAAMAEPDELVRVLVNLMKNAIEAMQDAPLKVLRVQARRDERGERAILTVCDSGAGIPAEILPHLFQPFFTSKKAGAGLGLGLTISAEIVRAMGGTLRGENDRSGGGACFTVDLALATVREEAVHE